MRAKPRSPRHAAKQIETVDQYLAAVRPDQRAALQRLRRTIRRIVPDAEECISYRLPAFRHRGRMLVWYGAGARHCAFYPGAVVTEFADQLEGYETSKGTVRFQPDDPLPATLVKRLVKARMKEVAARARAALR